MYDFIRKLKDDSTSLEVLGNGKQVRNLCYVENTVGLFFQG